MVSDCGTKNVPVNLFCHYIDVSSVILAVSYEFLFFIDIWNLYNQRLHNIGLLAVACLTMKYVPEGTSDWQH